MKAEIATATAFGRNLNHKGLLLLEQQKLPRMDSNHDKQIQSLLCYRYTTRQYKSFAGSDLLGHLWREELLTMPLTAV